MKLYKNRLVMLLALLFIGNTFGQNVIFKTIQQEKKAGNFFKKIPNIFIPSKQEETSLSNFKNKSEVYFYNLNLNNILNTNNRQIEISIPIDNETIDLELIEVSNSFNAFNITTSDGQILKSNKKNKHFRGIIKGNQNSVVAISFLKNKVIGFIANEKGNFNFSKLKNKNLYILFNEKNLKNIISSSNCFTEDFDKNFIEYEDDILSKNTNRNSTIDNCLKVYFETDFGLFQNLNSSVGDVEDFVTSIFNQVSTLYLNENISIEISEIFVWTTNDNYSSSVIAGKNDFVAARPNFNGDLAHLLSYRNGDSNPNNTSNAGGVANGINGLCVENNSTLSPHSHTSLFPDYELFPVFSRQVKVITHEIGHNLGSRHTHACVWNGNNTAIDGCSNSTEGNCSVPSYPNGGGTIMSYCDRQSVGINFSLGFGPQPGNVIRNTVENASCLIDCNPTCNLNPSTTLTTSNITYNSADISWTNVSGNNGYQIEYKQANTTSWNSININIPNTISYTLNGLLDLTTYQWRIRTKCDNGEYGILSSISNFTTPKECLVDITRFNYIDTGTEYIEASNNITSYSKITGKANVTYSAGNSISLKATGPPFNLSFNAKPGHAAGRFLAKIEGCENVTQKVIHENRNYNNIYETNTDFINSNEAVELEEKEIIKLYPNPTNREVNITSTENMSQWKLTNQIGRVIDKGNVNNQTPMTTKLSLQNLPTGIYFIKVRLKNGEQIVKRIIKK